MKDNLVYQEQVQEELIDGRAVAMSPRPMFNHNHIAGNLYVAFSNYLRGHTCTPIMDGTDLYLTEKDRFVPDMMVVCDRSKIKNDGVHGAPDLVVEVLSPSTAKRDKTYKKDTYEQCGVREYWLVNPADKSVEIYRLEGRFFVLFDIYHVYPDWMLERMTEEERAEVAKTFQCSLYDDFDIVLEDVFSGMLP